LIKWLPVGGCYWPADGQAAAQAAALIPWLAFEE